MLFDIKDYTVRVKLKCIFSCDVFIQLIRVILIYLTHERKAYS